jgi:site-specific recombinase XerD
MAVRQAPTGANPTAAGSVRARATAFRRHLKAENASVNTIATYRSAVDLLADFLERESLPTDVASLRREHIEAFIAHLLERWKPATANNRFRGRQWFFNWLAEEGEVTASPQ